MTPHLVAVLRNGISVVLDFPANTTARRAWMRSLSEQAEVPHRLHYLDVPDDICRARMHRRNARGSHEYQPTGADFDLFTRWFTAPIQAEGFDVVVHRP